LNGVGDYGDLHFDQAVREQLQSKEFVEFGIIRSFGLYFGNIILIVILIILILPIRLYPNPTGTFLPILNASNSHIILHPFRRLTKAKAKTPQLILTLLTIGPQNADPGNLKRLSPGDRIAHPEHYFVCLAESDVESYGEGA
jgi:hypothetical protein